MSNNGSQSGALKKFSEKHTAHVQGWVYFGAAILVIIVGLRGLGTTAGSVMPTFLLHFDPDLEGYVVSPSWVMFGLVMEFIMLCLLALVTYHSGDKAATKDTAEVPSAEVLNQIKDAYYTMINHEIKRVETINKQTGELMKELQKNFEKR